MNIRNDIIIIIILKENVLVLAKPQRKLELYVISPKPALLNKKKRETIHIKIREERCTTNKALDNEITTFSTLRKVDIIQLKSHFLHILQLILK